MSKERLSKLQKGILLHLYKGEKEQFKKYGYGGYTESYRMLRYNMNPKPNNSNSHRSKFSQSVRNLDDKGLIELKYCNQEPKLKFRDRKACEGKHPLEITPCEDCPYLKKYRLDRYGFGFYDGRCHFDILEGYRGKECRKKRVYTISITDKGRDALIKSYVTPKMIKEVENEVKWLQKEVGFEDAPSFEDKLKNRITKTQNELK